MSKKKNTLVQQKTDLVDETALFKRVSAIIEKRKHRAGSFVNREVTLMYWEVVKQISSVLLGGERAEYGKRIIATLSQQLIKRYDNGYVTLKRR